MVFSHVKIGSGQRSQGGQGGQSSLLELFWDCCLRRVISALSLSISALDDESFEGTFVDDNDCLLGCSLGCSLGWSFWTTDEEDEEVEFWTFDIELFTMDVVLEVEPYWFPSISSSYTFWTPLSSWNCSLITLG